MVRWRIITSPDTLFGGAWHAVDERRHQWYDDKRGCMPGPRALSTRERIVSCLRATPILQTYITTANAHLLRGITTITVGDLLHMDGPATRGPSVHLSVMPATSISSAVS